MAKKIMLTKLQATCVKMYCKDKKSQAEISIALYGDEFSQGTISRCLRSAGKKLKIDLTTKYNKSKLEYQLYDLEELL